MKLGKFPARIDRRTILLKDIAPSLPKPPDFMDWMNGKEQWGMMGNDVLGDCTCAALGHAEQTLTDNCVGMSEYSASDDAVIALYSGACGYVPGKPSTDQGGYGLNVLKYVRNNGLFGNDQLLGFAAVHVDDVVRVKQAIAAYGGVYVGLQLPDSVVSGDLQYSSWDLSGKIVPNPYNGHMVWIPKYNASGPVAITWGIPKQMSWAFWLACCDEAWAIWMKNWLAQYGNLDQANQAMENALKALS